MGGFGRHDTWTKCRVLVQSLHGFSGSNPEEKRQVDLEKEKKKTLRAQQAVLAKQEREDECASRFRIETDAHGRRLRVPVDIKCTKCFICLKTIKLPPAGSFSNFYVHEFDLKKRTSGMCVMCTACMALPVMGTIQKMSTGHAFHNSRPDRRSKKQNGYRRWRWWKRKRNFRSRRSFDVRCNFSTADCGTQDKSFTMPSAPGFPPWRPLQGQGDLLY